MRIRSSLAMLTLVMGALSAGCTAKVEEEGSLPDVDVQGGEAPRVDVDPAQVNVGTDTNTVVTPDINVTPQQ